jgi:predicted dehydrogenase
MKTLNWGILGPGRIARKFADGLRTLPGARLVAVGSRDLEKAASFAREFGAHHAWGSYEALLADPEVEIVYIASPHSLHMEHTLMCLEAGKHVLCEKPFARNAAEARLMEAKAREKGLFMMEAMWTRFLPLWQWLAPGLRNGLIGEVCSVQADFGFRAEFDPNDRKFNPALAGGALLDVGIYPVSLACWLFGSPVQVQAHARKGPTGIDNATHALMRFGGDELAVATSSIEWEGTRTAWVMGSEGHVQVPLFWRGSEVIVHRAGTPPLYKKFPFESTGLQYQAQAAHEALATGLTVHPVMPPVESVAIMEVLDSIRNQIGLKYPGE